MQWRRHVVDWGGHVHYTLLEVAPEIDTNPTSFYRGRGRGVAPPPDPGYRLALRARHVCPPHIFLPGDAPVHMRLEGLSPPIIFAGVQQ